MLTCGNLTCGKARLSRMLRLSRAGDIAWVKRATIELGTKRAAIKVGRLCWLAIKVGFKPAAIELGAERAAIKVDRLCWVAKKVGAGRAAIKVGTERAAIKVGRLIWAQLGAGDKKGLPA